MLNLPLYNKTISLIINLPVRLLSNYFVSLRFHVQANKYAAFMCSHLKQKKITRV